MQSFEEFQRANHCAQISYEQLEKQCYDQDAEIARLQAEANRTMKELCEARGEIAALTVALREVKRLDKLTPKTDWIDIQAVVDDALKEA